MPRTNIPITSVAETGTAQPAATVGDAANDHYIEGGTNVVVECKNTSGGALDVTFETVYTTPGGVALADNIINVGAGAVELMKLSSSAVRAFYQQGADLERIYVNVTSNSWEFRVYGI